MFSTYEQALQWIHSRLRLGIKPGLKRMEWMMEKLKHPEQQLKAIHVAGTNGKGSTVCYLRNMLQEAGYTVGTFTSPYIEIFNERISLNGVPIGNNEILELTNIIKPLADELEATELGAPSEFEVITAMAIHYFSKREDVDFVIFETGLGGRLDSTNIIKPLITAITNIGYDHMNLLGNSLEEIAFEKAGILKVDIPLVTTVEQETALEVMMKKAEEVKADVYRLNQDFFIGRYQAIKGGGENFSFQSCLGNLESLTLSMKGFHQVKNASLALMILMLLLEKQQIKITEDQIRIGLQKARWIGRFETVQTDPQVIIDGAHNPEGIASLLSTIDAHLSGKKVHIIFSALSDKKLEDMINPLSAIANTITFTSFDFPRVATAKELYDACKTMNKSFENDWKYAISKKLSVLTEDDVLIITGSLYFLSEVRSYFQELKTIEQ
ncbi:bifunctional folylpolyglutamate synthase/dihydrofolate synthase [Bacillus timonensis]|nr:bifunctional folylpolyglutamate synthase/dihydrofolate synthase [Bacillus timonensis]